MLKGLAALLLVLTSATEVARADFLDPTTIPPGLREEDLVPWKLQQEWEQRQPPSGLFLYAHQHKKCFPFYARYDYEAWVQDANGARVGVDRIELFFVRPLGPIGGAMRACDVTSYCPFTDKQTYAASGGGLPNPTGACTSSTMHACARYQGHYWCTQDSVN